MIKKILSSVIGGLGGGWIKATLLVLAASFLVFVGIDYTNKKNNAKECKKELAEALESLKKETQSVSNLKTEISKRDNRIARDSVMYLDNMAIQQANIKHLRGEISTLKAQRDGLLNNALCRKVVKNMWGKEKVTDELIKCTGE